MGWTRPTPSEQLNTCTIRKAFLLGLGDIKKICNIRKDPHFKLLVWTTCMLPKQHTGSTCRSIIVQIKFLTSARGKRQSKLQQNSVPMIGLFYFYSSMVLMFVGYFCCSMMGFPSYCQAWSDRKGIPSKLVVKGTHWHWVVGRYKGVPQLRVDEVYSTTRTMAESQFQVPWLSG